MENKKDIPEFKKLPPKFIPWKGRSSFDMPQELFGIDEHIVLSVVLRNGEIVHKKIFKINWHSTFKKTDVVGYKKPKCLTRERKKRNSKSGDQKCLIQETKDALKGSKGKKARKKL